MCECFETFWVPFVHKTQPYNLVLTINSESSDSVIKRYRYSEFGQVFILQKARSNNIIESDYLNGTFMEEKLLTHKMIEYNVLLNNVRYSHIRLKDTCLP